MTKPESRRAAIQPRMLKKVDAAIYCGVAENTFGSVCPVRPVSLSGTGSVLRYDMKAIDEWLDGLSQEASGYVDPDKLIAKMGAPVKRIRLGT